MTDVNYFWFYIRPQSLRPALRVLASIILQQKLFYIGLWWSKLAEWHSGHRTSPWIRDFRSRVSTLIHDTVTLPGYF